MTRFSTQGRQFLSGFNNLYQFWVELGPELKILSCNPFNPGRPKLFMSYSSMRGSDYLLQENKIEAMEPFLLPGINAENV